MNTRKLNMRHWAALFAAALLIASPVGMTSCKEDISEDAYAVKQKDSMMDYITKNPELSMIKRIFDEVKLGNSADASALSSVLSARGNYTVFAPDNHAITAYLNAKGFNSLEVDSVADPERKEALVELKNHIALSCVIDNGTTTAYELADLTGFSGTIPTTNLSNRFLDIKEVDGEIVINVDSRITTPNVEVSNGMCHVVDKVIAPSIQNLATLIKAADNMRTMGTLLEVTGWADSLQLKTKEEMDFQNKYIEYAGTSHLNASNNKPYEYQATRKIAYTAFVETDEVLFNDWGIPMPEYDSITEKVNNWEPIIQALEAKCAQVLGGNDAPGDYKNPKNAVNIFMAYHLLDGGMAPSQFVQHFNEYGYDFGADSKNPQQAKYTVNVWDYFVTKGNPRGLLKITQIPTTHEYFINRVSEHKNDFGEDYSEVGVLYGYDGKQLNAVGQQGLNIKINTKNGENENNALNGFYYPIDHVLVYNEATRDALAKERIRIDVASLMPELYSNGLRGTAARYFPNGYFKNVLYETNLSELCYTKDGYDPASGGAWKDYQGDEFLICGRYDFVFRLPPVPTSGTYELRMGASFNNLRGMFQVYIAEEHPLNQIAIGLPIDQRESVSMFPGNPWVKDGDDATTNRENDRNLRNQGYMKAPNYFASTSAHGATGLDDLARNATPGNPAVRRILTTRYFDKNKVYYLRFKSALQATNKQFMLDYFEFVPKSVIDAAVPEDIW